jgi:signal transduction histidine kinase
MKDLAQVLIGRDEPPAWRSARSKRLAYVAAWAGWALLATSAVIGATLAAGWHRAGVELGSGGSVAGVLGWLVVVMAVSSAIPLAPRYPLLAWRIGMLGVLITPLVRGQNRVDTGYYLIVAVALTVAGLRYGPPRLWWLAVGTLIPVWLWTPTRPLGPVWQRPDWTYPLRDTIGLAVLVAALYAAGRWRRDRMALAARSREATEQAELAQRQGERARQAAERSAVLAERARIAREMHDVVAHHMSMIAVQAETAPYRIADLPEGAAAEFAALSQAAREALADMRRLLGVLRSSGEQHGSGERRGSGEHGDPVRGDLQRAPQPGLADVPALVDSARRAGAQVTLEMPDHGSAVVPAVAPMVALTAYRIVQESLSNAARHAPGAPIMVRVREEAGVVRVTVVNEEGASLMPLEPGGTGGHGLAGMRERVALVGGQLRAGPEPAGGFAVRAELPA